MEDAVEIEDAETGLRATALQVMASPARVRRDACPVVAPNLNETSSRPISLRTAKVRPILTDDRLHHSIGFESSQLG